MSELSADQKTQLIESILLDSPPGEIGDVFQDVRTMLGGEDPFLASDAIRACFQQYNLDQFIPVLLPLNLSGKVEGSPGMAILSQYAQLPSGKYLDPITNQSFTVDHLTQTVSDVYPISPTSSESPSSSLRRSLGKSVQEYVAKFYHHGRCAVYETESELIIIIVANKYNPSSFWNGRWRSLWCIKQGSQSLEGTFKLNIHCYEDGNVQLDTQKQVIVELREHSMPEIMQAVERMESEFQRSLNQAYDQLSEHNYKSLRRALPITRSKIEWQSIANYKIGSELSSVRKLP